MIKNGMRPVHPGEILREDYLKPFGLSINALARHLLVPASRINDIVLERRGITADTALRLSRYFGGDAQSWMNLQTAFDLRSAELNPELQATLQLLEPMESISA
ncbi:MAG TPA: HigA family addiction module antitoxin [Castellaniella sp.]|uniref:HigA family addiction module antitoxin n=1 Tax=Castellaniella sp. TaxID=1955812 RepID=UPI002F156CFF